MLLFLIFIGLLYFRAYAQDVPNIRLSNGLIKAKVLLPDSEHGFYKGARFDWAGVISQLEYKGHSFFGKWFIWPQDSTKQNTIMGPVEAFDPLGYQETKTGGHFVKIGIGVLENTDDAKYYFGYPYKIVDTGEWTIKHNENRVEFNHRLTNGPYPYSYTKTIEFLEGVATMRISHTLKNSGSQIIDTQVFNHNYFVIDENNVDAGYQIQFPFKIIANNEGLRDFAEIENNQINFKSGLAENEHVYIGSIKGFSSDPQDYNLTLESINAGVGVNIMGDRPLSRVVFWAATKTACPEPYIDVKVAPGESFSWTLTYNFYTL
ncbi:hypothetical protein [Pricia sp.]|uniref:hypothetical protein n=1 Tax=Pricia sp. TaxID=2268138 RepID=UPI003593B4B0